MSFLRSLIEIDLRALADLMVVALLFWALVLWVRRTRARLALAGLAIVGGVYLLARELDLRLTAWILQGFFAVFVIVLVVVFQEDLRRLFEQIAVWGLRRQTPPAPPQALDILARTVARLAATRTGALLVLPGREPLDRHVEGGILLDGRLSEPLLLSLFDPHSPGHDGAVVVGGDRVMRFALHLPLSSDRAQLAATGTRHAAGLGLAERTDALCVVVSEERGSVSVAREGRLRRLRRPEDLAGELRRFQTETAVPAADVASVWRRLVTGWREALAAVVAAAGVWVLVVPGSTVTEVERTALVRVENLPEGFVLDAVEPSEVQVVLSGRRRDLVFRDRAALSVPIDALLVKLGRRTFDVEPERVRRPPGLTVVAVEPTRVRVSVRQVGEGAREKSGASGPNAP